MTFFVSPNLGLVSVYQRGKLSLLFFGLTSISSLSVRMHLGQFLTNNPCLLLSSTSYSTSSAGDLEVFYWEGFESCNFIGSFLSRFIFPISFSLIHIRVLVIYCVGLRSVFLHFPFPISSPPETYS